MSDKTATTRRNMAVKGGSTGTADNEWDSGGPNLNCRRRCSEHDNTQYGKTANSTSWGGQLTSFSHSKARRRDEGLSRCQDAVKEDRRKHMLHWDNVPITGNDGQLTRHQRSSFALPALPIDASISGGHGSRKSLNSRTRGEDIVKTIQSVCELSRLMILNG